MAAWTTCPSCKLKHSERPDGFCPRCRFPIRAAPAAFPTHAPPPAPPPPAARPALGATPGWAPPPAYPPPAGYAPPPGYAVPGVFSVGQLLSATFSTWFGVAVTVIPIAILVALPYALLMYRAATGEGAGGADGSTAFWAGALNFLLTPLESLMIARAGVRHLRREPVELGELFGAGMRSYLAALALLVLVTLAVGGSCVTIVGIPFGLFLLTAWAACIPAMAAEELGPIRALGRSWELTRGERWSVFGGFLVLFLVLIAVALPVFLSTGLLRVGVGGGLRARSAGGNVQLVTAILEGVLGSLLTTATAVAYHQLRTAREGHGAAQLGQVFQ
jgi:hypothetical protein